MPGEDGRRPNDEKAGPPAGPQPREPQPEDAVAATKPRATDGSLQDGQLMTQATFSRLTASELPRRARRNVQAPSMRIITAPNGRYERMGRDSTETTAPLPRAKSEWAHREF